MLLGFCVITPSARCSSFQNPCDPRVANLTRAPPRTIRRRACWESSWKAPSNGAARSRPPVAGGVSATIVGSLFGGGLVKARTALAGAAVSAGGRGHHRDTHPAEREPRDAGMAGDRPPRPPHPAGPRDVVEDDHRAIGQVRE